MLKDEERTLIVRRMTGNHESGYHLPQGGAAARVTTKSGAGIWEHNVGSFEDLCDKVSAETRTK